MAKLKALTLKHLRNGNHGDGGGLYLRVANGSRTYSFRFQRDRKQHWLAIGRMADWSLSEARDKALQYRRMLSEGRDPVAEKRANRAATAGRTLKEVATEYIDSHKAGWKNAKHGDQWRNTLDHHAAKLMAMPVDKIGLDDVLACLKPIWTDIPETASRLRGRIESILSYATVKGWRTGDNPARWKGNLDALLPARSKVAAVQHQPALPFTDMTACMSRLASSKGMAARCARFTILTAARSTEAREVTWDEIDLEKGLWTVPASRMKGKREHRVPLSPAALAVLAEVKPDCADPHALVFPGQKRGKSLSDVAVSKALHVAAGRYDVTLHGCRSSFRDWVGESAHAPRELAEAALAHKNADRVEAAYARSDLLERRRELMGAWADYCTGK
jgi:integrase